jgi:hypothetical protein
LCDIMFPEGLTTIPEDSSPDREVSMALCGDPSSTLGCRSVGVGGVTVVCGVMREALGGVLGGPSVSRDGSEVFAALYCCKGLFVSTGGSSGLSGYLKDLLSFMFPPCPPSSGVLLAKLDWKLRSGLVLGLFCDLPDENTSLIFLAGDFPRNELPILFLLTDRLSESGLRLSALSISPGMGKTGVLLDTGCE